MTNISSQINLRRAWLICAFGIIFYSYEFLLRIAPSVMVPELRAYFNITAEGFGALIGLYYLAYTPMQLIVGVIMDLYGPRRILTFAVTVCVLGSFIFGNTHSVVIAGMGRFLIGFGSAFAFVGALKLAALWLPADRFATFAGIVGGVAMIGAMIGDIGLTSLVQHIGWQATILMGTIVGAILIPFIWFIVRDRQQLRVDQQRITFRDIVAGFVNISCNLQIWLSGLVACLLYLALSAFAEIWGIPFLRDAYHFSPQQAALANSMIFLGWVIGGPLSGWISDRIHKRRLPLLVGSIVAAISMTALLYLPGLSFWSIALLLLIFGLSTSVELICFAVGHESVPTYIAATAMAFINMLTMAGGFVFQPLIGKLLDVRWSGQLENGLRIYSAHDYRFALTAIPIAMIGSTILILFMRESFGEYRNTNK